MTAALTAGSARCRSPETRVVYVDYDPVVLAHARALLTSSEQGATEYIDADLRDTGAILTQARQLLDFSRPVAITLAAILHVIPDSDDPRAIVAGLLDAVPSGGYLAISHLGADLLDREKQAGLKELAGRSIQQTPTHRSRDQVAASSRARTWSSLGWCESRSGARIPVRATQAGRLCGAPWHANADALRGVADAAPAPG